MELQEVGRGFGDWMEFAQDRDRWREYDDEFSGSIKFGEFVD
jgi:hypothetical protein